MSAFTQAIEKLDTSLFQAVPSQTSDADRRSLLAVQREIRKEPYAYLEIGSHLGGTIQPHYADPACQRIYSIDKRPRCQPDERGERFEYKENSTATMLDNLRRAFPDVASDKITTFDADAAEVPPQEIMPPPRLCLIDGEHTNEAVISDFRFCRTVAPNAVVLFHDAGVIVEGIRSIKAMLAAQNTPLRGLKLGGSLYMLAPDESASRLTAGCSALAMDEDAYFRSALYVRRRLRREARLRHYPGLLKTYRCLTGAADRLYRTLLQGKP